MADEDHLSEQSPSTPNAAESASQFCLCKGDPKIPRPRNAFILYRQHRQAAVVAQNPGMPNPDISKIIGEQWRSLPAQSKDDWKALAEEEKARHQQQYPEYRYQPRRNGRQSNPSSLSGPSSGASVDAHGKCLKCGGKTMNPPSAQYPPYTPVRPYTPQTVGPQSPELRPYALVAPPKGRPQMQPTVVSPQSARVRPFAEVFGRTVPADRRMRYAASGALTPMILDSSEPKRRRFNGSGFFIPAPGQLYDEQLYQPTPTPNMNPRPEARPPMVSMAPPRRAVYSQATPLPLPPVHPPQIEAKHDPSLTLPPLQTSTAEPPQSQTQKSGVEAMIMSMPVLNKVKTLNQISPHLSVPGIVSPDHEVRGAMIAIEGMDSTSVFSLTNSLAEQLEKEGRYAVRIFCGPDPYESMGDEAEAMTTETFLKVISTWHKISREMVEYITTNPCSSKDVEMDDRRASVADLFQVQKMVQERPNTTRAPTRSSGRIEVKRAAQPDEGITGFPSAEPKSPSSAVSPRTIAQTADLSLLSPIPLGLGCNLSTNPIPQLWTRGSSPIPLASLGSSSTTTVSAAVTEGPSSPTTTPSYQPFTSAIFSNPKSTFQTQQVVTNANTPPPREVTPSQRTYSGPTIPIAIVPHYQLTTVDASSIAMPITDAYSPLSHWQWLATLWRGCVGPDVTVVIRAPELEAESPHNHGNVIPAEKGRAPQPGVEVRLLECRSIIVRQGKPVKGSASVDYESFEKAKRRVGFEVEEFLRK